jgi:hypothetical protein
MIGRFDDQRLPRQSLHDHFPAVKESGDCDSDAVFSLRL